MFSSLVIRISPKETCILPPFQGYFVYAAILSLIQQHSFSDTTKWHDPNKIKPFTMSGLYPQSKMLSKGVSFYVGQEYSIRLSFIFPEDFEQMLHVLWNTSELILWGHVFYIRRVSTIPLQHKDAHFLLKDEWERKACTKSNTFTLLFRSPTAFRSGTKKLTLLPEPSRVFQNLSQKSEALWLTIKPEGLDFNKALWIQAFWHMNTHVFEIKQRYYQGFTGRVRYEIQTSNEEWHNYIWKLAILSPYLGVGTKTTMGMGQTQIIYS